MKGWCFAGFAALWKAMGFVMGMELLQNIRQERALQRRKKPLKRAAFNTISCIVKGYGLDESFLGRIDRFEDCLLPEEMELTRLKGKKAFEFPPFCLVSQEGYGLALSITNRLDNPYLEFARSPEEILLSLSLYRANPSLEPDDLMHHDFETLLLCHRVKIELAQLEKQLRDVENVMREGEEIKEDTGEGPHAGVLRERMKRLQAFVEKVENH